MRGIGEILLISGRDSLSPSLALFLPLLISIQISFLVLCESQQGQDLQKARTGTESLVHVIPGCWRAQNGHPNWRLSIQNKQRAC